MPTPLTPRIPINQIVSPTDAIARLKEGNGRFTAGNLQHPHESNEERAYIAKNSYENPGGISLGIYTLDTGAVTFLEGK